MNMDIAEACAAARYNESVHVSITVPSDVDAANDDDDSGAGDNTTGAGRRGDGTAAADGVAPPGAAPSPRRHDILLVASLDRENGGIRWNDVSAIEDPIERHLRTKVWLLPMLNDHRRTRLYRQAIRRASRDVVRRRVAPSNKDADAATSDGGDAVGCNTNSNSKNPDRSNDSASSTTTVTSRSASPVTIIRGLDIGSGTGLLAMMSARYLKESIDESFPRPNNSLGSSKSSSSSNVIDSPHRPLKSPYRVHITSLEMSGPMAALAQRTVALNGYGGEGLAAADHEREQRGGDDGGNAEDCDHHRVNEGADAEIQVVEAHSCAVRPLRSVGNSGGALLCTSELLESGLLGEGWIPAMRDAWHRHLDPHGSAAVVVPQRARVYAQVVEGEGVSNYWGPHKTLRMNKVEDAREGSPQQDEAAIVLSLHTTEDRSGTLSDGQYDEEGNKDGIQVPIHLEKLIGDRTNGKNPPTDGNVPIRLLSDPIEVLDIDVTSKDSIPHPGRRRSQTRSFVPTASGKAQGIAFWWEVDLYEDLTYSTKPGASPWQDHWHQCLYVFPRPVEDCVSLVKGQPASIIASHTDTRLHFSVQADNDGDHVVDDDCPRPEPTAKRCRPTIAEENPVVTPHRCWQLNDVGRSERLRDWIEAALDLVGRESANVLDISDFSLCGMMASLLGAGRVTSVESSSGNLAMASARVAQLANGLIPPTPSPRTSSHPEDHSQNPESGRQECESNTFQVLQCYAESLTRGHLYGGEGSGHEGASPANLVVGEPYYEVLEGWCIEEALNFFYTLRMLRRRGVVSGSAVCVPGRASIMACGIECPDIADAYRPCGASLAGFDHTTVREYCRSSSYNLSLPLWEYDVTPMTEPVELALLDYEQNCIVARPSTSTTGYKGGGESATAANEEDQEEATSPSIPVEVPYIRAGTCHAVMLWVEYGSSMPKEPACGRLHREKDAEGCSLGILSTNTRSYKQVVRMLLEPVSVHSSDMGTLSLSVENLIDL